MAVTVTASAEGREEADCQSGLRPRYLAIVSGLSGVVPGSPKGVASRANWRNYRGRAQKKSLLIGEINCTTW
jgi:hypothetical protein